MNFKKLGLFLLDTLCVLLFSLASALILLPALGHEATLGTIFFIIFFILLWFSTGFIRLWLPFALAAILFLIWFLSAPGDDFSSYIIGYFSWTFSGMGEHAVYATDFHRHLTWTLILLPVVLVYSATLHKFFSLWLLSLVTVALLGAQASLNSQELLLPFLILCGVMIICLPRTRLRTEGRLRAQLLAALFALPILLCSLWVGPEKDGEWTSKTVQNLVHDTQDLYEYYLGDLPQLNIRSMRDSSWMPQGDTLGGDVELNTDTLMTIYNTRLPFLLRGEVLDHYTGHAWQDTGEENYGNFRLDSGFWRSQRQQALELQTDSSLLRYLTHNAAVTIRNRQGSRTVYLPYGTSDLTSRHNTFYFNLQGETAINTASPYSYSYDVLATYWSLYDGDFDRYMLQLEELSDSKNDDLFAEAARLCLQVPETMPDWALQLCDEIVAEANTPYEKVIALRNYLAQNCEYTLTPGLPDEDMDFVAYFLQTQKGYCVYYATALTMMCRLEGIPARYVTGYGMIQEEGSAATQFTVTEATGHAWTEVYLNQIGWVPVDALSQDVFQVNSDTPQEVVIPAGPGTEDMTEEELPPEPLPQTPTDPEPEKESHPWRLLWLLPVLILLGLFIWWGMGYYPKHYSKVYVQKHYPEPADAAEYYYTDLLRQLRIFGVQPQGGDTLLSLGERADRYLPEDLGVCMSDVCQIMNRLRFGEYAPTLAEVSLIHESHDKIEAHLRKTLGAFGYFFRRFITGLLLQIK